MSRLPTPTPIDIFSDRDRPNLRRHLKSAFRAAIGELFLKRPPPRTGAPRRLLNAGCGPRRFDGFVNADFYSTRIGLTAKHRARRPDWMIDVRRRLKCDDNYWHGIFTEHMIEHLTFADARFALAEMLRTLKPGGWLRVTVPDLKKFATHYLSGDALDNPPRQWAHKAEAMADLTQMWGHQSVWDAELMAALLADLGFADIGEAKFREGNDPDLLQDDPEKQWETLYMEARKPTH